MQSLRRGYLWLAAGLVLAVTAGITAFVAIQRASSTPDKAAQAAQVQALVAARDIPLHSVLGAGDVVLRDVPLELMPEGGLKDPKEAVGKLTTTRLARGEIVLGQRLMAPDYVGPNVALVIDPKQVVVALPANDLLGSLDIIRPGDPVDIMFSLDMSKANPDIAPGMSTMTVLQDVRVADVVRSQGSATQQAANKPAVQAILVAVDPQDALTIKCFRDCGASADLALRSPAATGTFTLTPIDGAYLLERYQIRWRARR